MLDIDSLKGHERRKRDRKWRRRRIETQKEEWRTMEEMNAPIVW